MDSYVVAFPSMYPRRYVNILVRNMHRILKIHQEPYTSISRDGELVLVQAHDPVFAASAISQLAGIGHIEISRRAGSDMASMVGAISEIGGSLLLAGDRFVVQMEGHTLGFLPRDVEMAATSSIIEAKTGMDIRPGTEQSHDRRLYCYATKRHAYISIFSDVGMGGLPTSVQGEAICCVFDEMSAASCLECIRMGYRTTIIACYRNDAIRIAKILDRVIPYLLDETLEIPLFRLESAVSGYAAMALVAIQLAVGEAAERGISNVALPISRTLFAGGIYERLAEEVVTAGMVPVESLPCGYDMLHQTLRYLNLQHAASRVKTILRGVHQIPKDAARVSCMKQVVSLKPGPNNVHDILDSLR